MLDNIMIADCYGKKDSTIPPIEPHVFFVLRRLRIKKPLCVRDNFVDTRPGAITWIPPGIYLDDYSKSLRDLLDKTPMVKK